MRSIILAVLASVLPTVAFAKTTLHIPLFVEITVEHGNSHDYQYVPMAVFNKTLIEKGQKAQLESVDLELGQRFDFLAEHDKVDAAIEAAGIKNAQAFGEYYPANWGDEENYTCYRGSAKEAVDIALENTDNLYSDQYTLFAWRVGKKIVYGESFVDDQESRDQLSEESEEWKNYDKKSDTILMIGSVGDDGTDFNTSVIPRCK